MGVLLALALVPKMGTGGSTTGTLALAGKTPLGPSKPTGITLPAGKFYSYAPSTVEEGNTRHVFYFGNTVSGEFHNSIMVSVGTKNGTTWTYNTPRVAFGLEDLSDAPHLVRQ